MMQAKEFKQWMAEADFNGREAAEVLGKSEDTISRWRTTGVPKSESAVVRLACAAIVHKVAPWFSARTV